MPRYLLTVEYDGTPFCGWQRQRDLLSVQEAIEDAVVAFVGTEVTAQAAGRTDAGVHALGQRIHLDLPRPFPPETVQSALNHHLQPHPVSITASRQVTDDVHARFSAQRRFYRYRIVNRRAPLTVERDRALLVVRRLDAERMHDAAQCLVGHHDFSSFRASECQAESPEKTLERFVVRREGDRIDCLTFARSFLHHQVRNIVGTLVMVGQGDWPIAMVKEVLAAKDRRAAGPMAPAAGLYLERVDYPGGL